MNRIENDVFTLVATKLRTEFGADNIYITGEYTRTPPKFPCVFLQEADNFNAGYDGCNHEHITGVMYELEVYSNLENGKKTQAKNIAYVADKELTRLGFRRMSLQAIPNYEDATIYRLIGRYAASVIDNVVYRR